MGFLSKLFSSRPPSAGEAASEKLDRITPIVPPVIPAAARPTPADVHERPTVLRIEAPISEDRATVLAPEVTTTAALSSTVEDRATVVMVAPEANAALAKIAPRRAPPLPPRPSAPPSVRAKPLPKPPPPFAAREKPPPSLQDDLDASFAALEAGRGSGHPGKLEIDLSSVRALFGQLATNHMRQLRDFVIELRWGPAPTTWVAVCEPSIESLKGAAEKLEFRDLVAGLTHLASAMQKVYGVTTPTIEGAAREEILAAYAALEATLPDTFAIDGERSQREAAILHALLSQISDVHKVTIDKLYAAGLTTLETLLLATTEDLVATTGIPETLAARIVARFHDYRQEMASVAVDETRAHERAKLAALAEQLRQQNVDFDRAAAGWTSEAIQQKKDIVVARTQTMLEIDLQLARLGEIALVRELERLPFARKLARLGDFLAEAEASAAFRHP